MCFAEIQRPSPRPSPRKSGERERGRRALVVERNLFRRPEQDIKDFVDETRVSILLAGH